MAVMICNKNMGICYQLWNKKYKFSCVVLAVLCSKIRVIHHLIHPQKFWLFILRYSCHHYILKDTSIQLSDVVIISVWNIKHYDISKFLDNNTGTHHVDTFQKKAVTVPNFREICTSEHDFFFFVQCAIDSTFPKEFRNVKIKSAKFVFTRSLSGMSYTWEISKDWCHERLPCLQNFT